MVKKALICSLSVLVLSFGFVFSSQASDGDTLTLSSSGSTKQPPVIFPHKMHQDAYSCGECHHGMDGDGKQVPYVDGQEIKNCESCHNDQVMAGNKDLASFKDAGHGNCLECHKKIAKEDSSKKKLRSCKTCHVK